MKMRHLALLLSVGFLTACGEWTDFSNSSSKSEPYVELLSELMIGVDEALTRSEQAPPSERVLMSNVSRSCAQAQSECSSGVMTVLYDACRVAKNDTWKGQTRISYYGRTQCRISNVGESLLRSPNYERTLISSDKVVVNVLNARQDGLLIKKIGVHSFTASVGNLQRSEFSKDGRLKQKHMARVDASLPLQIIGQERLGRVMTGGRVKVEDTKTGTQVELIANALLWSNDCTCPVSGDWIGTIQDDAGTDSDDAEYFVRITLKGCGGAERVKTNSLTNAQSTESISLPFCTKLQ